MKGSRLKPDLPFYKKGEAKSQEKSGDIISHDLTFKT
jgi:hypothetical protein